MFIYFRYDAYLNKIRSPIDVLDVKNDFIVSKIQESVDFFAQHANAVILNEPNFFFPNNIGERELNLISPINVREELIKKLTFHQDIDQLNMPLQVIIR